VGDVFGGVLCAGFGTRLSPITDVIPKPLVPFLNTPTVAYGFQLLINTGVDRIAMNLHHLPDTIPPVVDRLAPVLGFRPVYVREWEILGTGGGIRGIWKGLGEPKGTLVVLNGDSVTDIDLEPHIRGHEDAGAEVTLIVRPKTAGQPGRVFLNSSGELSGIRDFRRPGRGDLEEYEFTGIHLLSEAALNRLSLEASDIVATLYGPMVAEGAKIRASVCDEGFWAALDNPSLILENTRRVLADPSCFKLAPLPDPMSDGLFIYNPDDIDPKAKLTKPIFLGAGVELGSNTFVGPNVVMDGVQLAPGARVENAVIYGMGRIEGHWQDCVAVAGKVAQAT